MFTSERTMASAWLTSIAAVVGNNYWRQLANKTERFVLGGDDSCRMSV